MSSRSQCLMVDVQASRFGHMKKIDNMFCIKIISLNNSNA